MGVALDNPRSTGVLQRIVSVFNDRRNKATESKDQSNG